MNHLDHLENKSIFILREAYYQFPNLAMLWSIGKDSTVLLHLAKKAFFKVVPFPLIHIDTGYKIPEMIIYRDQLALNWKLQMLVGKNVKALKEKRSFPNKTLSRIECCNTLKTEALKQALEGKNRFRLNHESKKYERDTSRDIYTGLILGIRADEEGSRSKERIFSPRDPMNGWNITQQPPEFWDQYNTEFPPKAHVRIHPLLDWTELDIWHYIRKEQIPVVSLYFNQGNQKRYRSLGCGPCTNPIHSHAKNVDEVIYELKEGKLAQISERSGRAQDKEDGGGLEELRKSGYM